MMDKMKKDVEDKKEKEATKKRNFTLRTLGLVSPIIVNVIFGIILFVNITQISIISNSPLWCAAWVIFSFFTICTSISFLQERDADIEDDDETVTTSAVLPIIMAVASVIVFCHAITLKFDFDPPTFIKMTATNKEESITSQGNTTKIYFTLVNEGNVDVSYFYGEMKFYNDTKSVGTWYCWFENNYEAGKSYTPTLTLHEKSSTSLYDTPYENLHIDFKITKMRFNGNYDEYIFDNSKYVSLK